jgi:3-hydroxybutyrate dehydrogenase
MTTLHGHCALVTGSTQGLGLATARRLAADGCHVVLNGFGDGNEIETARQDIEARQGVRAIYIPADLRSVTDIEQMIGEAATALGPIDVVVNNAVTRHASAVEQLTTADWDEDVAVNLSAAFHTIRLTLPGMKTRNWGRIVNVSSIYGLVGAVNRAGYVTTKTALIGLTRAVALETAGCNITCNAVCPGTTATPVHEASLELLMKTTGMARAQAERQLLTGKQPTGRLIPAEGVAELIAFLCRPENRDITGGTFPIDGAWSAQ